MFAPMSPEHAAYQIRPERRRPSNPSSNQAKCVGLGEGAPSATIVATLVAAELRGTTVLNSGGDARSIER
jgi:hypothetical protein